MVRKWNRKMAKSMKAKLLIVKAYRIIVSFVFENRGCLGLLERSIIVINTGTSQLGTSLRLKNRKLFRICSGLLYMKKSQKNCRNTQRVAYVLGKRFKSSDIAYRTRWECYFQAIASSSAKRNSLQIQRQEFEYSVLRQIGAHNFSQKIKKLNWESLETLKKFKRKFQCQKTQ